MKKIICSMITTMTSIACISLAAGDATKYFDLLPVADKIEILKAIAGSPELDGTYLEGAQASNGDVFTRDLGCLITNSCGTYETKITTFTCVDKVNGNLECVVGMAWKSNPENVKPGKGSYVIKATLAKSSFGSWIPSKAVMVK
jgi:hypothetical protein